MPEENKPTEQAPRSFVDPKDFPVQDQKATPAPTVMKVEGKEIHILRPEVALTLIYGKLSSIETELKMLNGVFSKAAESKSFVNTAQPAQTPAPVAQSPPTQSLQTPLPTEQTPRVKEILAALEPVKDLLHINLDESSMFVMVRPAQFLGSDNFAKVAQIIRAIGGQYVSAGKNSHFEVPKAPLKK
jgi:hypothetical protein